jgi:hypothetical protein
MVFVLLTCPVTILGAGCCCEHVESATGGGPNVALGRRNGKSFLGGGLLTAPAALPKEHSFLNW